jgi:hypothetical protein
MTLVRAQEPRGVTSQKTPFFTENLVQNFILETQSRDRARFKVPVASCVAQVQAQVEVQRC